MTDDRELHVVTGAFGYSGRYIGPMRLPSWAGEHAATPGRRYATELGRRKDRRVAYADA